MAKAASVDTGNNKLIPADCVSVLLMAIGSTSISKSQYDMMSALDGTRTASSFEHQFRSITAKAKSLKARVDNGEQFAAIEPTKKRGAATLGNDSTPQVTPKKPKTTPKTTPKPRAKKVKATVEDESPGNDLGSFDGDDFNLGFEKMLKQEKDWDEEFC